MTYVESRIVKVCYMQFTNCKCQETWVHMKRKVWVVASLSSATVRHNWTGSKSLLCSKWVGKTVIVNWLM